MNVTTHLVSSKVSSWYPVNLFERWHFVPGSKFHHIIRITYNRICWSTKVTFFCLCLALKTLRSVAISDDAFFLQWTAWGLTIIGYTCFIPRFARVLCRTMDWRTGKFYLLVCLVRWFYSLNDLTHYRPAIPFGKRKKYFRGSFQFSIVTIKEYHPSGNLTFPYLGIFHGLKLRILTGKNPFNFS